MTPCGYKFLITNVKKQNSLYYSVFFNRWELCPCNSSFDTVLLFSDVEIDMETDDLYELVQKQLQLRKS